MVSHWYIRIRTGIGINGNDNPDGLSLAERKFCGAQPITHAVFDTSLDQDVRLPAGVVRRAARSQHQFLEGSF